MCIQTATGRLCTLISHLSSSGNTSAVDYPRDSLLCPECGSDIAKNPPSPYTQGRGRRVTAGTTVHGMMRVSQRLGTTMLVLCQSKKLEACRNSSATSPVARVCDDPGTTSLGSEAKLALRRKRLNADTATHPARCDQHRSLSARGMRRALAHGTSRSCKPVTHGRSLCTRGLPLPPLRPVVISRRQKQKEKPICDPQPSVREFGVLAEQTGEIFSSAAR